MDSTASEIKFLPHHEQKSLCTTRAPYRQGRNLTAVKVYTINDESAHLLIHGVPSIGLHSELLSLCERYGHVRSIKFVDEYHPDQEKFTDVFHVHFERIQSARFAKKIVDNKEFYGGILHVCYAPELETIPETKLKLVNRKKEIAKRTQNFKSDELNSLKTGLISKFSSAKSKILNNSTFNPESVSSQSSAENCAHVDFGVPNSAQNCDLIAETNCTVISKRKNTAQENSSSRSSRPKKFQQDYQPQSAGENSTPKKFCSSNQTQNCHFTSEAKIIVTSKRKNNVQEPSSSLSDFPKKSRLDFHSSSSVSHSFEPSNSLSSTSSVSDNILNLRKTTFNGPFKFLPRSLIIKKKINSHDPKFEPP